MNLNPDQDGLEQQLRSVQPILAPSEMSAESLMWYRCGYAAAEAEKSRTKGVARVEGTAVRAVAPPRQNSAWRAFSGGVGAGIAGAILWMTCWTLMHRGAPAGPQQLTVEAAPSEALSEVVSTDPAPESNATSTSPPPSPSSLPRVALAEVGWPLPWRFAAGESLSQSESFEGATLSPAANRQWVSLIEEPSIGDTVVSAGEPPSPPTMPLAPLAPRKPRDDTSSFMLPLPLFQ